MTDVDGLILASRVQVEISDPRHNDARYCLRSYFEELDHRFETGFDPGQSISASDEEMTLPNGLLLVATLLEHRWDAGRSSFTLTLRLLR